MLFLISRLIDLEEIFAHYPSKVKYYIESKNEQDVLEDEKEIRDFFDKEEDRKLKYVSIDSDNSGLVVDIELF